MSDMRSDLVKGFTVGEDRIHINIKDKQKNISPAKGKGGSVAYHGKLVGLILYIIGRATYLEGKFFNNESLLKLVDRLKKLDVNDLHPGSVEKKLNDLYENSTGAVRDEAEIKKMLNGLKASSQQKNVTFKTVIKDLEILSHLDGEAADSYILKSEEDKAKIHEALDKIQSLTSDSINLNFSREDEVNLKKDLNNKTLKAIGSEEIGNNKFQFVNQQFADNILEASIVETSHIGIKKQNNSYSSVLKEEAIHINNDNKMYVNDWLKRPLIQQKSKTNDQQILDMLVKIKQQMGGLDDIQTLNLQKLLNPKLLDVFYEQMEQQFEDQGLSLQELQSSEKKPFSVILFNNGNNIQVRLQAPFYEVKVKDIEMQGSKWATFSLDFNISKEDLKKEELNPEVAGQTQIINKPKSDNIKMTLVGEGILALDASDMNAYQEMPPSNKENFLLIPDKYREDFFKIPLENRKAFFKLPPQHFGKFFEIPKEYQEAVFELDQDSYDKAFNLTDNIQQEFWSMSKELQVKFLSSDDETRVHLLQARADLQKIDIQSIQEAMDSQYTNLVKEDIKADINAFSATTSYFEKDSAFMINQFIIDANRVGFFVINGQPVNVKDFLTNDLSQTEKQKLPAKDLTDHEKYVILQSNVEQLVDLTQNQLIALERFVHQGNLATALKPLHESIPFNKDLNIHLSQSKEGSGFSMAVETDEEFVYVRLQQPFFEIVDVSNQVTMVEYKLSCQANIRISKAQLTDVGFSPEQAKSLHYLNKYLPKPENINEENKEEVKQNLLTSGLFTESEIENLDFTKDLRSIINEKLKLRSKNFEPEVKLVAQKFDNNEIRNFKAIYEDSKDLKKVWQTP